MRPPRVPLPTVCPNDTPQSVAQPFSCLAVKMSSPYSTTSLHSSTEQLLASLQPNSGACGTNVALALIIMLAAKELPISLLPLRLV